MRDYVVAHYKLNTREDSKYWKANRENTVVSDSARNILDVWYRQGSLTDELKRQEIETLFGTLSWHSLLVGYGVFPPLAQNQTGQGDLYKDHEVQHFLTGCALNFNSHQQNLANLRPSKSDGSIQRERPR